MIGFFMIFPSHSGALKIQGAFKEVKQTNPLKQTLFSYAQDSSGLKAPIIINNHVKYKSTAKVKQSYTIIRNLIINDVYKDTPSPQIILGTFNHVRGPKVVKLRATPQEFLAAWKSSVAPRGRL